jgi:hypothetical protein
MKIEVSWDYLLCGLVYIFTDILEQIATSIGITWLIAMGYWEL